MADLTEGKAETASEVVEDSALGMSDEDFLKLPMPSATSLESKPASDSSTEATKVDEVVSEALDEGVKGKTDADAADDADGGKPAKEKASTADDGDKEEVEGDTAKKPVKPKAAGSDDVEDAAVKEPKPETSTIDYKAEYERLVAPFKANGRDIQVKSVDDAIALMQMGANYNKKMAALKPNLKLMKMLENNGLMSEDKISFMIDLGKKDPAAINKLMQESGLDPMDLDAEKAKTYKPKTYAVGDQEIELDTVLDELKDSPSYTRTLDVVSNKWDAASKHTIASTPQLLRVIDSHLASGIYDLISTEVEREKVFGRLNGLSDIEAYRKVGDAIQARGGFDHLAPAKGNQGQPKPAAAAVVVPPKPKVEDDKLKDKRRAASSTKPAAPDVTPKDFNPLALSDAEFSKLVKPKFL